MKTESPPNPAPLWLVAAAFAAVYVIWGSTYLAIRYAVETIPPFLMAGSRNLAAGLLLLAFARARGAGSPGRVEWRDAAVAGTLMLVVGNGGVTWAEQYVPSAMTALLVALTPFWMVLLDWMRPGGVRPRAIVAVGLAIGLGGVGLLAGGSGVAREPGHGWGVAAVLAASLGWALGSIFNRSARKPASPFLAVAMQMTAGGVLLLVLAAVRGEANRFSLAEMSPQSFGAWVYLTLAGSLVAYTAYVWLLHATTPARVATYAYVNPLIAVLLGCTLGHESFSKEMFAAGGLIILAVALIVSGGARPARPAKRDAASVQAPACAASEIS